VYSKCVAGVGSTLATYSTADTYTWVYLSIPGYTWTLTTVHLMSGGHPLVGFYPISPLDGVKIPNFHESTNGSMMNIVLEVKNIRYYFGLPFAPSLRCQMEAKPASVCSSITLHYFYAKYSRCTQREQTQSRMTVGSKLPLHAEKGVDFHNSFINVINKRNTILSFMACSLPNRSIL